MPALHSLQVKPAAARKQRPCSRPHTCVPEVLLRVEAKPWLTQPRLTPRLTPSLISTSLIQHLTNFRRSSAHWAGSMLLRTTYASKNCSNCRRLHICFRDLPLSRPQALYINHTAACRCIRAMHILTCAMLKHILYFTRACWRHAGPWRV